MQNVKNTMVNGLLGLLAPHLCCSCGATGTLFCGHCKTHIRRPYLGYCWVCNFPSTTNLCQYCRRIFISITCVGVRVDGLQRLIGSFKFSYARSGAVVLAELLCASLSSRIGVLVPVPTQSSHVRVRGYDHIDLVAQSLARLSGLGIERVLVSVGHHTQHRLGRRARQEAVRGSFVAKVAAYPDRDYIVLDDIITTGSTMIEAAQCLREAGARRVHGLVVARQASTERSLSVKIGNVAWRGDRVV